LRWGAQAVAPTADKAVAVAPVAAMSFKAFLRFTSSFTANLRWVAKLSSPRAGSPAFGDGWAATYGVFER